MSHFMVDERNEIYALWMHYEIHGNGITWTRKTTAHSKWSDSEVQVLFVQEVQKKQVITYRYGIS